LRQWIEDSIVNFLVPSTFEHDVTPITLRDGETLLAIKVPASIHLVSLWDRESHTVEYVCRTSHGKRWMNPDEAERHIMDGSRVSYGGNKFVTILRLTRVELAWPWAPRHTGSNRGVSSQCAPAKSQACVRAGSRARRTATPWGASPILRATALTSTHPILAFPGACLRRLKIT
jgi:hypothetical protein